MHIFVTWMFLSSWPFFSSIFKFWREIFSLKTKYLGYWVEGNERNISRNSPPQIPVKLLHYFMTICVIFLLKESKDWSTGVGLEPSNKEHQRFLGAIMSEERTQFLNILLEFRILEKMMWKWRLCYLPVSTLCPRIRF